MRKFDHSGLGYRGQILTEFLKPEYDSKALYHHVKNGIFIPSPDRHELENMILEEHQFPLSDAVEISDTAVACRDYLTHSFGPSLALQRATQKELHHINHLIIWLFLFQTNLVKRKPYYSGICVLKRFMSLGCHFRNLKKI